jgi:hypothetical protein
MIGSTKRRVAALAIAGAALASSAGAVAAVAPTVETSTVHIERPFTDCPGFSVLGVWDISHRLTIFYDSEGTPIRDIEQVEYTGRLVNTSTGAWVADGGAKTYFDTLAPDGSYLTTYGVEVRRSAYVHTAGRWDFQTGELSGLDGFTDAGFAALCEALGG